MRTIINWGSSAPDINIVSDTQIDGDGDIDRVCSCLVLATKFNNVLNCIEKEELQIIKFLYIKQPCYLLLTLGSLEVCSWAKSFCYHHPVFE